MGRIARVVARGMPHHVAQRGNRRMATLFCEADSRACLALLSEWARRCDVRVWAQCLMPNRPGFAEATSGRRASDPDSVNVGRSVRGHDPAGSST
jgi:hypothetical protein